MLHLENYNSFSQKSLVDNFRCCQIYQRENHIEIAYKLQISCFHIQKELRHILLTNFEQTIHHQMINSVI